MLIELKEHDRVQLSELCLARILIERDIERLGMEHQKLSQEIDAMVEKLLEGSTAKPDEVKLVIQGHRLSHLEKEEA